MAVVRIIGPEPALASRPAAQDPKTISVAARPAAAIPGSATQLAPLREDIALFPGPRRPDGSPSWVLEDPAANIFYTIGWREFEMLSRWSLGSPEAVVESVRTETALDIQTEDIGRAAAFLAQNGLLRASAAKVADLHAKAKARGLIGLVTVATGQLLFKKIRIFSPDDFLARTVWLVQPLFSARFLVLTGALMVLAFYLMGRQWGQFVAGFGHLYSFEGAIGIGLALTVAKSVHELAHAYAAKLNGVEVPSMGVSFILFWPVLYTETSGAWRLPERHRRLSIAAAGVASELVLAVLALLAWSFMDAGWRRETMQFAATSLVVLSLAINANPLMRFDGYFVLCDISGLDNLQPRSLALLGWAFRRLMAGAPEPSPERGLSVGTRVAVMAFGAALGLYRVSLYSGIAYGLTASVWPAFGLTIAVSVIVCFLARPVSQQCMLWFRSAARRLGPILGPGRVLAALTLMILPIAIPWRTSLMVPVVLRLGQARAVFAPEPSVIVRMLVADGEYVSANQPLIEMGSPDLDYRLTAGRLKEARLSVLLDQHRTGTDYQEDEHVEEEEIRRLRVEIAGFEARRAQLTLRAVSEGVVRDVEPGLRPGTWVRDDRPLMRVVAGSSLSAEAFVEERDLSVIVPGAAGFVWLDGLPFGHIAVRVQSLYDQAIARIEAPIIAGPGGGPISVKQSADGGWVPEMAIYKAELELTGPPPSVSGRSIETRGFASIETPPRNFIGRLWDHILGVWRREIG